jgi:hypothetical protein
MVIAMRPTLARTLAISAILVAYGMLACAMALGGDVPMIFLGLVLAAASMALFQRAEPERED